MRILAALICFLTVTSAYAGIGEVSENKGTACEIHRSKNKMPGHKGSQIESMDSYVTGACAAQITFKDNTKVKVTENSKLLIDDFVFDPKQSDSGKLAMKVGMGTVRYASGQIAKNNPQRVDIKTPTASIAVRGTDFTMTVDETGQSLIVLVPSCKDEKEQKKYELDEQLCKVGKISVTTLAGSVDLEQAFEGTYVMSSTTSPTPPVIMNITEGRINNNLIIVKPTEIQRAVSAANKGKKSQEEEELEQEAQRQMMMLLEKSAPPPPPIMLPYTFADGKKGCNPSTNVCVNWERNDAEDMQSKGKGVAFRSNEEHYAEVKTLGHGSNTFVEIIHNDHYASTVIGDGSPGGNHVTIKQNAGVSRK
jgi:hypothetical protein